MNKENAFRELYKLHQTRNEWIDSIPYEIRDAFFDNPYVECLYNQVDVLMKAVFTVEEQEAVDWFLWEWDNNNSLEWIIDGVEYRFKNIDEYIEFLQKHLWI